MIRTRFFACVLSALLCAQISSCNLDETDELDDDDDATFAPIDAEHRFGPIPGPDGPRWVHYVVTESGKAIYQGDIAFDLEYLEKYERRLQLFSAVRTDRTARWEDGEIPYNFDDSMATWQRNYVNKAIKAWNDNTVIRLVERTDEADYVTFERGDYNTSAIGRVSGQQTITVNAYTSNIVGVIMHEIGHAAGLWHEQARQDRGAWVTIHEDNIDPDYLDQFDTYPDGFDHGDYDYDSIMHYPVWAFRKEGTTEDTISANEPLPRGVELGQRVALSSGDIAAITALYYEDGPCLEIPLSDHDALVHVDYYDDVLVKNFEIGRNDVTTSNPNYLTTRYFFQWRLNVYGKAFRTYSRSQPGIRVYVNATQVCEFWPHEHFETSVFTVEEVCRVNVDLTQTGDSVTGSPFRIGNNRVELRTASHWNYNAIWVGIDKDSEDSKCDHSAWNNRWRNPRPEDVEGELMMTQEIACNESLGYLDAAVRRSGHGVTAYFFDGACHSGLGSNPTSVGIGIGDIGGVEQPRPISQLSETGLPVWSGYPKTIAGVWNRLPNSFLGGIDAAVDWGDGHYYLFKGDELVAYHINNNRVGAGYPRKIADEIKGLASRFKSDLDGAMKVGDRIFLFKGSELVLVNPSTGSVDFGPYPIRYYWRNMPSRFHRDLDSVVDWEPGKAYFFKDREYVRIDLLMRRMDAGYPRDTATFWPGLTQ